MKSSHHWMGNSNAGLPKVDQRSHPGKELYQKRRIQTTKGMYREEKNPNKNSRRKQWEKEENPNFLSSQGKQRETKKEVNPELSKKWQRKWVIRTRRISIMYRERERIFFRKRAKQITSKIDESSETRESYKQEEEDEINNPNKLDRKPRHCSWTSLDSTSAGVRASYSCHDDFKISKRPG